MGRKRANPKKDQMELVFEDGYYWIVQGTKRLNVGRNKRVAEQMLADRLNK